MSLIQGFLDGLRPTRMLTVDKWADANRRLGSEAAAEPGPWRTSKTPYLRQIMEDLSPHSPINEVIVQKGVQLGATESGLNMVGCYMDIAPCPIMYVMPTIEMAKSISRERIDTMIINCESLNEKVAPKKERDSGNTILHKSFPGGVLALAGANSAASLRSRPVKVLIFDEIDAAPLDVDGEGSPVSLAQKRTSTFGDKRKIYKLSTPTIEQTSVINKELMKTEVNRYHVPCPHCGGFQHLVFERLKYQENDPETTLYQCVHCEEMIEERFKPKMLAAGEWKPDFPDNQKPNVRGYHINSLYSPLGWYSWKQIIEDWLDAQNDVNKLKTFTNTVLGETWKEEGDAPEWEVLYNRRMDYRLNQPTNDVSFITVGVDVQKNRVELEIVGWIKGKISQSIDYRVFEGDTSSEASEVWDKLGEVVNEEWIRPDGVRLPMYMMAIDSGYQSSIVYSFCRRYDPNKVRPVKGNETLQIMAAAPRQVDITRDGQRVGSVMLWSLGVSVIKSELYGWLRLHQRENGTYPIGYCMFPQYHAEYFKGITAERLEFKLLRGHRKYQWVKYFERNEPLDCRVYARAAAYMVGMDRFDETHWQAIVQSSRQTVREKPSRRKSSYWDQD